MVETTCSTRLEWATNSYQVTRFAGTIDWDTRYAHMRMHTAQHLMSGLAYELFDGVRTVGNQIHADRSRIDFNPISFDESMLEALTNLANDHIDQHLPVTDDIMTRGHQRNHARRPNQHGSSSRERS